MESCWSSYFLTTLALLFTVRSHLVRAKLNCSADSAQGGCRSLHPRGADICQMQADVCPPLSSDSVSDSRTKGCTQPVWELRPNRRPTTTNLSLSFSPVVHNTISYNLTVSWEHIQLTIPAGSYYHLKLFSDARQFFRCICSNTTQATEGSPSESFNGLVFKNGLDYKFVELTIFYPNGSDFVIATNFDRPRDCLEVLPVSLYRCPRKDDELRYQTVKNLTHNLVPLGHGYEVKLSWEPSADATLYMLPVQYYITVHHSGNPSETFETNTTSIVISPLLHSIEYAVQVQQFIPCSKGCGGNVTQDILTKPSSSPEITQVYPLSASNINVTWNEIPESDYNGIIINYEVKYRSVSKDVGGMSLTMNTTGRSINLSGLKAFTEYNISVRGYTSAGPGPFSEELTRRTMNETIPTTFTSTAETIPTTFISTFVSVLVMALVCLMSIFLISSVILLQKRMRNHQSSFTTTVTSSSAHEDDSISKSSEPHFTIEMITTNDDEMLNRPTSIYSDHTSLGGDLDTVSCNDSVRTAPSPFELDMADCVFNPIVVISQRTLGSDKEEIDKWLMAQLKRCVSRNGARIVPTVPGMNKENVRLNAYEWLEMRLSSQPNEPCFLCVINQEFKDEWDCGFSSTKEATPNHCLIYPLSRHLFGMAKYRINASKHIMVLHWTDTVPTHLVPHGLRECQTAHVKDTKKIAEFVFKQSTIAVSSS